MSRTVRVLLREYFKSQEPEHLVGSIVALATSVAEARCPITRSFARADGITLWASW